MEENSQDYSILYSEVKDLLNKNDAFIFNIETVVTDDVKYYNKLNHGNKRLNIITKPLAIKQAFAEINATLIANLANNH